MSEEPRHLDSFQDNLAIIGISVVLIVVEIDTQNVTMLTHTIITRN